MFSFLGCNYRYTFKEHLFNSPGYPSFYPNNATCLWKIVAKEGWHVQLTIIDLNIENSKHCEFDSVTIYDGEGETAIPIKKLCGVIPPEAVRSVSNIVTILMTSDETVNGKGFRIKYKMVPGKTKVAFPCSSVYVTCLLHKIGLRFSMSFLY